jgi:hypothetical protein
MCRLTALSFFQRYKCLELGCKFEQKWFVFGGDTNELVPVVEATRFPARSGFGIKQNEPLKGGLSGCTGAYIPDRCRLTL